MIAENCKLNGEWCKHVKKKLKRYTSHIRRQNDKKVIKFDLSC